MIEKFENFNPRIKRGEPKPYQLHVKWEHGDADSTSKETLSFTEEDKFKNMVQFYYECMNFTPNVAYGKMGYFYPIPDEVNRGGNEEQVYRRLEDIGKKYGLKDIGQYIESDNHYNQGFAALEGIKATINGNNKVFVFKDALATNKINLPSIGDVIDISPDHISGYGTKLFGEGSYLPNSGKKDYSLKKFKGKIVDAAIDFHHDYDNKYFSSYTYFPYKLLVECDYDVLNKNHKFHGKANRLTYDFSGWDPEFEVKFNKSKYDGLNYYEI